MFVLIGIGCVNFGCEGSGRSLAHKYPRISCPYGRLSCPLAGRVPARSGLDSDPIVHSSPYPLLAAKVLFCCLNRNVSKKKLNLLQLTSGRITELRAGSPEIMWSNVRQAQLTGVILHHVPYHLLGVMPSPHRLPARQTHRNSRPAEMFAADSQRSTASFTQSGTGTVRI